MRPSFEGIPAAKTPLAERVIDSPAEHTLRQMLAAAFESQENPFQTVHDRAALVRTHRAWRSRGPVLTARSRDSTA